MPSLQQSLRGSVPKHWSWFWTTLLRNMVSIFLLLNCLGHTHLRRHTLLINYNDDIFMFLNFALDIFWLLKQTYTFLKAFIFLMFHCWTADCTLFPLSHDSGPEVWGNVDGLKDVQLDSDGLERCTVGCIVPVAAADTMEHS